MEEGGEVEGIEDRNNPRPVPDGNPTVCSEPRAREGYTDSPPPPPLLLAARSSGEVDSVEKNVLVGVPLAESSILAAGEEEGYILLLPPPESPTKQLGLCFQPLLLQELRRCQGGAG
eukprot:263679-Hanusia_phi.AAC.4